MRPELTPLPPRLRALQVDARGYPVPWFVAWVDGQPDFRVIVRFEITLPDPSDKEFRRNRHGWQLSPAGIAEKVAQAERQKWRALLLVIKAKLESVENQIATFEEEFLAHIVLPNQQTVAQFILPVVQLAYDTGKMPSDRLLAEPEPQQ